MARKLKAEVRINDTEASMYALNLELTSAQAVDVLETLVSDQVLYVNLLTGHENGQAVKEAPKAYAE